jgi:hypothetical protein
MAGSVRNRIGGREVPKAQRPPDDDFGPTWLLLRPLKSPRDIPASLRFRAALKALLRQYHLRCERVARIGGPDNEDAEAIEVGTDEGDAG